MESKYKKGDWVRLVDLVAAKVTGLTVGNVYKVNDVIDDLVYVGSSSGLYASRFEPWRPKVGERVRVVYGHGWDGEGEVTIANDRLFTVRLKTGEFAGCEGGFALPDLEPVTDTLPVAEQPAEKAGDGGYDAWFRGKVKEAMDDTSPSIPHEEVMESVKARLSKATPATALLITAGRFYKTRDGRKVGPMRASTRADWPFIANAEGESDAWYMADGTCPYIPHDDLIAEWVDTPVRDITAATVDAINDEYGPVVREVPVAEQPVRFRVGDWVTKEEWTSEKGWEVAKISETRIWLRVVGYSKPVGYDLPDDDFILVKRATLVATPTPAIVCKLDNGQPLPAHRPHVHATVEAADKEAARLAELHKGQEFGVFALTGTPHRVAKVYEHEWQRPAAANERLPAITALRRLSGIGLKQARDAVERFIEEAA